MRNFFRFAFISALVFNCISLEAQVDPNGKDIIKRFSDKMRTFQTVKATFSFTLENLKEGISDTYEGKLLLKGKKYNLELMGMHVYFDGITKWQFIPQASEVTISKPKSQESSFFEDPTQIFTDYEKDFKSKFIGEKVEGGKSIYEVDLYPNDLNATYSIIKLKFERDNLEPFSIKYQGKDGNNYIIKVKRFRSNLPAKDEEFVFETKKHKGLEIVDLR